MKPAALIVLTLLLSSCWPYYKQLDANNKPVTTDVIVMADCNIRINLNKKFKGDKDADYHVALLFTPVKNDINVNVADISVRLFALKSGKEYTPVLTKFRLNVKPGDPWVPVDPASGPAVHNGQVLALKAGESYSLIYSFSGHHHPKLKLDINANINGQTAHKSLAFEKFTEVELLH